MADDGAFLLERPVKLSRYWFVSPAEPRDFRTFEKLAAAAIGDLREAMLTDERAAQLLALIGKHGRESHTRALERHIQMWLARRLATVKTRQPIKGAFVDLRIVPRPRSGCCEGVLILSAWGHWLRSTLPLTLSPGT